MSTTSEKLQIIYNSVSDIRNAITERGGQINGDITTLGDSIRNLSGGSTTEEYTFIGTITTSMMTSTITGKLSKRPSDLYGSCWLCAIGLNTGGAIISSVSITVKDLNEDIQLIFDWDEPVSGEERPMLCLVYYTEGYILKIANVKFIEP